MDDSPDVVPKRTEDSESAPREAADTVPAFSRFAEAWFADARREAAPATAGDLHARRREIVFSVHSLESYLVEWVVDLLATRVGRAGLLDALQTYFPESAASAQDRLLAEAVAHVAAARALLDTGHVGAGAGRLEDALDRLDAARQNTPQNLNRLWREIPRRLHDEQLVPRQLGKYAQPHRGEFRRLIDLRNAMTHANLSPPAGPTPRPEDVRQATTTTTELMRLAPGWAVRVAAERIRQMHELTGTTAPPWIMHSR
jgi:hypothetical protein